MNPDAQNAAPAAAYIWLGAIAIGVLALGIGMWGATAQVSGAVVSAGTLALDQERHSLQLPRGGVVAELLTQEGAQVDVGDLLMRLDTAEAQAELGFVQAQLFEMMARQDRLNAVAKVAEEVSFRSEVADRIAGDPALGAVVAGQLALFDAQRETTMGLRRQLRQRQQQIAARIKGIDAQIAASETQIALLAQSLQKHRSLLARGLAPAVTVLEMEREMAVLKGHAGELQASRAQASEQIAEIGLESVQRLAETREKAVTQARDLDAPIRKMRTELRRLEDEIAAADIRAPVSGTVFGLTVRVPRAVLRPAEPFLSVIPSARTGIVTLRVEPSDIDLIALGQQVKLRLSALDQRLTPEVFGQVLRIGADTAEDNKTGAPFFEVEVTLSADALRDLPEGAVLLPGMPVEAFVETGTRTPLAYIVKPLTDYFSRAFREG